MNRLPCILLHMDATDSDRVGLGVGVNQNDPLRRQRVGELGYLISLRKIGIEIALPREDTHFVHLAIQTERSDERQIDGFGIEHRQGTRKA